MSRELALTNGSWQLTDGLPDKYKEGSTRWMKDSGTK